jgi:hypothetical protein
MTPDRETIERLEGLAVAHHGWPLVWLRDGDADLDRVRADLEQVEAALVERVDNSIARTLAKHLAVAAVGYMALARRVEEVVTVDQAVKLAGSVLTECAQALDAEGVSVADRLRDAIFEAVVRRPWAYPSRDKTGLSRGSEVVHDGREQEGLTSDGHVAVMPWAVKRIAREIGLADPIAALREMAERGDLVRPKGGSRLEKQVKIAGKPTWMYVFRRPDSTLPLDPDADGEAASG